MVGVSVCDQGSRLICKCLEWLVGGSVVGPLWKDWRGRVTVCLRGIVREVGVRRWVAVARNLLYFLEVTGGN